MTTQYSANSIKSVSMSCNTTQQPVNISYSKQYGSSFNTIVGYPTCPEAEGTYPAPPDYSLNYGYYIYNPLDFPTTQISMSYNVVVSKGTCPGVVQILGCNSGGGGGSYNSNGTVSNAGSGGTSGYLADIIIYLISNEDEDTEYSIACGIFCDSYCGLPNGNGSSGTPYSIIITNITNPSLTLTINIPDTSDYTNTTMGYCGPKGGGNATNSKFSEDCNPTPIALQDTSVLYQGGYTLNGKTFNLQSTYTYLNTNDTTVSQSMQYPNTTSTSPDGLTICNAVFPEVYAGGFPSYSSVCAGGALGSLPSSESATTSEILSVGSTFLYSPYLPFTNTTSTSDELTPIPYSSIPGGSYGAYVGNESGAFTAINSVNVNTGIATTNTSSPSNICCSFGNGGSGGLFNKTNDDKLTYGIASPPTLGFISFVFASIVDAVDVTEEY